MLNLGIECNLIINNLIILYYYIIILIIVYEVETETFMDFFNNRDYGCFFWCPL